MLNLVLNTTKLGSLLVFGTSGFIKLVLGLLSLLFDLVEEL